MPAMENPPAETMTPSPQEETKGPRMKPDPPPNDFLEIVTTKAENQTKLLTSPSPTGTTLPNRAESHMLNETAGNSMAEAEKANHLIKSVTGTAGKTGMVPKAGPATGITMGSVRNVLMAPSHLITVSIRRIVGDQIPGNPPTEDLKKADPIKQGVESLHLTKDIRREAKARQSQNALPTVLAASGRTRPTMTASMKSATPSGARPKRALRKGMLTGLTPKAQTSEPVILKRFIKAEAEIKNPVMRP